MPRSLAAIRDSNRATLATGELFDDTMMWPAVCRAVCAALGALYHNARLGRQIALKFGGKTAHRQAGCKSR